MQAPPPRQGPGALLLPDWRGRPRSGLLRGLVVVTDVPGPRQARARRLIEQIDAEEAQPLAHLTLGRDKISRDVRDSDDLTLADKALGN